MSVSVTKQDVIDAENFLETYMSDKITDGDYSAGSALRDLTIKAFAYIVAYLKKVNNQVLSRQSLLSLISVDTSDDPQAADDAANEILSNLLLNRRQGRYSHVTGYIHLSQRVDVNIKATHVFYKTSSLPFIVDNNREDLFIPADNLTAIFDATGIINDYVCSIPLVAQRQGADFNVDKGVFVSWDSFNPYVTKVETLAKASYGGDVETTTDFIARSPTAVSTRNMINARSCDATLKDKYPEILFMSVVGMGDSEMVRDFFKESASGLQLHVGGMMDVFLGLPITETSFSGVIGGTFARNDNVKNVFRDSTYADGATHGFDDPDVTTGKVIEPGMVLRIWEGLPEYARDYLIREVQSEALYVEETVSFPEATDENDPVTYVTWSVGQLMPDFMDVVPQKTTGVTSRSLQRSGSILLPGGPVYLIKDVSLLDPSDPDADPSDNRVHFTTRVNTTPVAQTIPDNQYLVSVRDYKVHQTGWSCPEIIVGVVGDMSRYDGKTLNVTYDTLASYDTIHAYTQKRNERVSGDSVLVRGYHPVYVSFNVEFKRKKNVTDSVDTDKAVQLLVAFVNSYDTTKGPLDVSVISKHFMDAYTGLVSMVYPITIIYDVHVPDGRVVRFQTMDEVSVPSDLVKLSAKLLVADTSVDSLLNPIDYGITDDVLRYLTTVDRVNVQERL